MNIDIIAWEYWDAELKNQSKKRLTGLEKAIAETGAIIVDRHEDKYIEGKLQWRIGSARRKFGSVALAQSYAMISFD